jgi:isoleucyl-tRNA synthetase
MEFRATLNLPDPDFTIPMKADLPRTEPQIQAAWDRARLYHRILETRKDAPTFVLHDGPAYTNSPIHIGTALNKILKDFVVKSHSMLGFQAPYVPGFDNHGLPIEQAVQKALSEAKKTATPDELRKACRVHAEKFVEVQSEQFRRLGVLGLWEAPYKTMDFRYEAELVRVFKRLVEGGYVYKGLRPTLWSPTLRTAIADTELVYRDHTSTAIYVKFPLKHDENGFSRGLYNFSTIIWTTTPWTIPANLACAFNPVAEYAIVRVGDEHFFVGASLVERLAQELGWKEHEILAIELGASLEGSVFAHPIFGRDSIAVMADYVTMDDGTGVVHTAPGHGRDDFYTGVKYHLPILCPVDERGVLTEEAGEFAGTYYKDCDTVVVNRLREVGALLDARPYQHSYPHGERDSQPVIFRATEQWFVNLEHDNLRHKMLKEVERVEWVPASGQARITAMVAGRPDWCISRQRPWGVGIPVFYGIPSNEPVLDPVAIEAVAKLVEKGGSDAWFSAEPKDILPPGYAHPQTGETEFRKETDTLDVWFDSGSTSIGVLEGKVQPAWKSPIPADLYLEGSDQHRGWFNSSLILSQALRGHAPYKAVVTHGFITDEQGLKMSKRLGNVVDPVEASNKVGADVIRYWVAGVDYTQDAPCSEELLKRFGENYRSVRNALRFLLANLYDFEPSLAPTNLLPIDEWAVEQADLLAADCAEAYQRYDFNAVITAIHNFCGKELSSFYLDVIKDRMYCDAKESETRRSGQAACRALLERLLKLLAPILPHTAEETWQRLQSGHAPDWNQDLGPSIHETLFDLPTKERLAEIEDSPLQEAFAALNQARTILFAAFEAWKANPDVSVKDSQDVAAHLTLPDLAPLAAFSPDDLATFLKFASVELTEGEAGATFEVSPFLKCERSRLRRADVELTQLSDGSEAPLSLRDRRVLGLA